MLQRRYTITEQEEFEDLKWNMTPGKLTVISSVTVERRGLLRTFYLDCAEYKIPTDRERRLLSQTAL